MSRAARMMIALDRKRRDSRLFNRWLGRTLPRVFERLS